MGILTSQNGQNTASDADTDIATALAFAYARWQDPTYLTAARAVISDIWTRRRSSPSREGRISLPTTSRRTMSIISSSIRPTSRRTPIASSPRSILRMTGMRSSTLPYDVLQASMASKLDATSTSANIPPDWITLGRKDATISAPGAAMPQLDTQLRLRWPSASPGGSGSTGIARPGSAGAQHPVVHGLPRFRMESLPDHP